MPQKRRGVELQVGAVCLVAAGAGLQTAKTAQPLLFAHSSGGYRLAS